MCIRDRPFVAVPIAQGPQPFVRRHPVPLSVSQLQPAPVEKLGVIAHVPGSDDFVRPGEQGSQHGPACPPESDGVLDRRGPITRVPSGRRHEQGDRASALHRQGSPACAVDHTSICPEGQTGSKAQAEAGVVNNGR